MTTKCKNCGTSIEVNYCPNCGQSAHVKRLELKSFFTDVLDGVFQLNHGLFHTFVELSRKPGGAIRAFLEGQRKPFFKPLGYLVLLSTVYFLVTRLAGQVTWLEEMMGGIAEGITEDNPETNPQRVVEWLGSNYAYLSLLLVPFYSLTTWLSFLRKGHNYLEHVVINAYITGHQAIIYALFVAIGLVTDSYWTSFAAPFAAMVYNFIALNGVFAHAKTIGNIFRTLLSYFIYLFFGSALIIVLIEAYS